MTRDVMVTIFGQQALDAEGAEQGDVELVQSGEYFERGDTKYLIFDESHEGMDGRTRNVIKLRDGYIEVKKRGVVETTMIFEKGKRQTMTYTVPYGSFLVETYTTGIDLKETEEHLSAEVCYTLFINGEHAADCNIRLQAQSKEVFRLEKG